MAAATENIQNISSPVLVYERPRFTDAMFAKARDGPLRKKSEASPSTRSNSLPPSPERVSNRPTSSTPSNQENISESEKPTFLRRLSSRARSLSSLRRSSVRSDSSARMKSQSFSAKLSRRLSSLFRNSSFSEGGNPSNTRAKDDELIVYIEETKT